MSSIKFDEKYLKSLVDAIKNFINNYKSSRLPKEVGYSKKEKTLQACLFHELINLGITEILLQEPYITDSGKTFFPDLILGQNAIICELKSTLGIKSTEKDLQRIEEYGKESIGVLITSGSNWQYKGHLRDYEKSIERFGYQRLIDEWELDIIRKGKYYFFWEHGNVFQNDRRLYLIINNSQLSNQ